MTQIHIADDDYRAGDKSDLEGCIEWIEKGFKNENTKYTGAWITIVSLARIGWWSNIATHNATVYMNEFRQMLERAKKR